MMQKRQISNGVNQETYRRLISDQSSGLSAALLRLFLRVGSSFYLAAIVLRNFLYSNGWLKTHRVNAVVISIGNITVGGTGKTPLVIWLCKQITQNSKLKTQNYRCAILTRGYKAAKNLKLKTQNYTDEVAILSKSCPEAKVIVNPDRVAGAAEALSNANRKSQIANRKLKMVLIMDDGFQHRRLARDLDIVTIDATRPFGYGKMFPAGLLREPVSSLKRADAVVITRCDQITKPELTRLEEKLQQINPNMIIARSIHTPVCVKYPESSVIPAKAGIQKNGETVDSCLRRNDSFKQLKGKKIFAFCGIGNPDAFLNTIRGFNSNLVGSEIYDDHYHYTDACLAEIYAQAKYLKADLILTTQKDWTQYAIRNTRYDIPFAYLAIELKFIGGEDKITRLIEDTLAGKIHKK